MAGRLREETLDRVVEYGHRILRLAEHLESENRPRRVIDQLIGSGTSVGANIFEAHEAMSKPDFTKCLCIAAKELHETVFWLRVMEKRQYIDAALISPLMVETKELLAIVKTLIARTRRKPPS